jgi:hypothetical protein
MTWDLLITTAATWVAFFCGGLMLGLFWKRRIDRD